MHGAMGLRAVLLVGVVLLLSLSAYAADGAEGRVMVFDDDFDDADESARKWTFQNGMGTVLDGVLVSPSDQDMGRAYPRVEPIRLGPGGATSIEFEVDYRTKGAVFPWDSSSYLRLQLNGQGGQRFEILIWNDEYEAKYRLDERGPHVEEARAIVPSPRGPGQDEVDFATYATHPGAAETGEWAKLRITVHASGTISVTRNGQQILEFTKENGIDETFGSFLIFSRHGFQQWEIDRVAIYVTR